MPISHNEAAKWSAAQWAQYVKHARASGDGAVGVLFIWTDDVPPFAIPTAAFVAKPLGGSAVSTTFAEKVLGNVVGADSPDSVELKKHSNGSAGIRLLVAKLVKSGQMTKERAAPYLKADSFVLQKMMHGYTEMSDAYKATPDGLKKILNNVALMKNLGKLAAADLILGNGDRVENGNFGNIMFNADGTIASIDSSSLLASFEQMAKASDLENMDYFGGAFASRDDNQRRETWVTGIAQGGMAAPTDSQIKGFQAKMTGGATAAPTLAPVAKMSAVEKGQHGLLFDEMKAELMGRVEQARGTAKPITEPSDNEWSEAKRLFVIGFKDGLHAVDNLLGGKAKFRRGVFASSAWSGLKKEYKEVGFSGVDPNLSWFSLVVRREMYMQLRRGKTMEQAIAAGTALAAKKQNKFLEKKRVG